MSDNRARVVEVGPRRVEAKQNNESGTRIRAAGRESVAVDHEVVITGIGVILPGCDTRETFWQQLSDGESQLAIEPDPADNMDCAIGRVRGFDSGKYFEGIEARKYASCHREQQFYLASLIQACRDAAIDVTELASDRVGLFDGTSRGSFAFWYEQIKAKIEQPTQRFTARELHLGMPGQAVGVAAAILGVKGPTYTFNGTCASGAIALGHAYRELRAGNIDLALGTGHDAALVPPLFQMYRDAGLISRETGAASRAVRPFTDHSTNAFGEGAVTLVLETRAHAEARGADILATVAGYRYGNGGDHPTDVDFTGGRPAELITHVLEEGEMSAYDVGFVLGHGNAVQVSDLSELNYMKRVFGRRTRDVPLISTKPIYGHTLGASSALNVAAAALMLKNEYVIPTINVDESRVVHGFNHQANRGVARALEGGVIIAYGMGGQNVALALRKGNR
jgi:3-oxoacyl-[acyl-carrier-protein] synthase II